MYKLFVLLFLYTISLAAWTQSVDYTNLKPDYYDGVRADHTFTDKGIRYRVTNTDSAKGLSVEIVENGRSKWLKEGVFYTYYDGKLTELITYSKGQKHGIKEVYYGNGKTQFRYAYKNDVKHGHWEQFNSSGEKLEECTYVDGEKEGKEYSYYKNKVQFEKDYLDGKRHGEVKQYGSDGKLVSLSTYVNGKQVGKTVYY